MNKITYTVRCDDYESHPFATLESAQRHIAIVEAKGLCKLRHHLHSLINGTQAPCVSCDPVLPNVVKLDGRTVCCDAQTALNMEGTEYCKGCQRAITGRA